ncbi:MAG: zinc ribbon domain-containing protein [Ruminococcus sp.]|nr:zinc ribbon domain-containing protein [Ruminococcus sp.]
MFCKNCGIEIKEGAAFCFSCGSPVELPKAVPEEPVEEAVSAGAVEAVALVEAEEDAIPQEQLPVRQAEAVEPVISEEDVPGAAGEPEAPEPEEEEPAAEAKKSHRTLKIVLIIIAAVLLVGAIAAAAIIYYIKHKPGNAVLLACAETFNSESFIAESETTVYIDDAISLYADVTFGNNIVVALAKNKVIEELKEELGVTTDHITLKGSFAVNGKDDDCVIYAQVSDAIQLRLDDDIMELLIGNEYTRNNGKEDIDKRFENNDKIRNFYNIIAVRGQTDEDLGESKAAKEIKAYFAENYDQLGYVLADMLNDTGAKYMKSFEKDKTTYTFNIDAYEFMRSLAANEKLQCRESFKKNVDKVIKKLQDKNISEVECRINATIDDGRIEKFVQSLVINGRVIATTTTSYSKYDSLDDDKLEMQNFEGEENFSRLLVNVMNFIQKNRLSTANSDAKLVYKTLEDKADDLMDEGAVASELYVPEGPVALDKLGESEDPLAQAVYTALNDLGEEDILVYWELDEKGEPTFAQVCREDSRIVGQYPDPETDRDAKHDIGTRFVPGVETEDGAAEETDDAEEAGEEEDIKDLLQDPDAGMLLS